MPKVRKIANELFVLLLEVIGLLFATGKNIVLPNKNGRGNLLSSLFSLFIGIINILDCFEVGLFQMAKVFRQKNVQRVLLIASVFLFLLTTFEWVPAKESGLPEQCTKTEVTAVVTAKDASDDIDAPILSTLFYAPSVSALPASYPLFRRAPVTRPVKTYLLNRTLLI